MPRKPKPKIKQNGPSRFWAQYESDPRLEEEGNWVDLGEGTSIRVRATMSVRAQQIMNEVYGPHRADQQAGALNAALDRKLTCDWVARGIIVDWNGLEDPENLGTYIPHSEAEAIRICRDERHYRFVLTVLNHARMIENFQTATRQSTAKN